MNISEGRLPLRVLQVLGRMDRGGAETMIMNIYRHIDRSLIQFDFVVHTQDECHFDQEIIQLGGQIFHCPRYKGMNHIQYCNWWNQFFLEHLEYSIVHSHVRSSASLILGIAKKNKRIAISHSHNTSSGKGISSFVKMVLQYPLRWRADYFFACSIPAGEWLFGEKITKQNNFIILNNAINAQSFTFDLQKRNNIRELLGIENKLVIGHIGRFHSQKNHIFLIEIFNKIKLKQPDSVLLLVGDGGLRKEIETKVEKLDLNDSVIFTGVRSDIPDLLQAMDVFLFPSLYEGLPVTMIEAQASGLPCVISETIFQEVKITDNVEFISLEKSPEYWAERVLSYQTNFIRKNTYDKIVAANYDIVDNAKKMEDFYLSIAVKNN